MERGNFASGKKPTLAAVVAGTTSTQVFSFKDAVVSAPPPKALPTAAKPSSNSDKVGDKQETQRSSKRPGTARSKIVRSKSVVHIVESPTFKKRCEALMGSECSGKHGGSGSPKRAAGAADTKPTALQELFEREKQLKKPSKKKSPKAGKAARDRASPRKVLQSASSTSRKSQSETPAVRARAASADRVMLQRLAAGVDAQDQDQTNGARKRASSAPEACLSRSLDESSQESHHCDLTETVRERRPTLTASHMHKSLDTDDDCDTNSESTAESSCPSPRHSPISSFHHHRDVRTLSPSKIDEHDVLSDTLSHDTDEDDEALMLLDRMNGLSAEFTAQREHEESNALCWSVQHAAQQGIISTQMQQNLVSSIRNGFMDEARDVLYHKSHLVPAVGSVVEDSSTPEIASDVSQAFLTLVDEISPLDAPEERLHKLHVLKLLSDLVTKWVKKVGYERGLSDEHIALTCGSLFLAGSYRLGLDDPNSDIDAVCVVPWHVTREDFFSSFCQLLQESNLVSHLAPVPNAYVPLIALNFLGVRMDLLFARLPLSRVESHQEIDSDHMLVGVHSESMKSLNAPRVSSMLLCLVPRRREFRIVLRAVRAWARRRGIYSAKLGYLGGISWAILVAFVCQLYPTAEPSKIFVRFFQVLSEWQWPQPIMLNMHYDAGLGFDMWDPRHNIHDRAHIMPIITPAYPHMNSSVQVSPSTFSVIYEELWRARYLAEIAVGISRPLPSAGSPAQQSAEVDMRATVVCTATSLPVLECDASKLDASSRSSWLKIFEPSNFFIRYGSYLVVDFEAASEAGMYKWSKFVQSRVRKLVDSLQHVGPVARVHAFPSFFPHTSDRSSAFGSCVFIGIEFHARRNNGGVQPQVLPQDDPEIKNTLEQTIRFFLATDLQQMEDRQPDMQARMTFLKWTELPDFVFPFPRANAEAERTAYQDELEKIGFARNTSPSFRPPFMPGFHRGGRWRGNGPRKYAGGQRKSFRRDGSRPFAGTSAQAG